MEKNLVFSHCQTRSKSGKKTLNLTNQVRNSRINWPKEPRTRKLKQKGLIFLRWILTSKISNISETKIESLSIKRRIQLTKMQNSQKKNRKRENKRFENIAMKKKNFKKWERKRVELVIAKNQTLKKPSEEEKRRFGNFWPKERREIPSRSTSSHSILSLML